MATNTPTILVADSSPTVLRIAESVLGEAGHHVFCQSTAKAALEAAQTSACSVALVASTIEEASSHELCKELHDKHGVHIILMTARGEQPASRFDRSTGVVDYIHKPFGPEALLAVVQHSLERMRRGADEAPLQQDEGDEGAFGQNSRTAAQQPATTRLAGRIARALGIANPQSVGTIEETLNSSGGREEIIDCLIESNLSPALFGDLAIIPMAEVFQLLSLQRQSGFLTVRNEAAAISIAFKDGEVRLVTAENMAQEFLLGTILIQEELMDPAELETFLTNRKGTRRRLGTQLVKLGYLEVSKLHQALRRQSAELIYELLRWNSGRFSFAPSAQLPTEVLEFEFGVSIDEMLMEGFRRVDEWGLIEDAIPSFSAILKRVPGGEEKLGAAGLAKDEKLALSWVDGTRSVQEVISELNIGIFEGANLLYRLVSARVIKVLEEN